MALAIKHSLRIRYNKFTTLAAVAITEMWLQQQACKWNKVETFYPTVASILCCMLQWYMMSVQMIQRVIDTCQAYQRYCQCAWERIIIVLSSAKLYLLLRVFSYTSNDYHVMQNITAYALSHNTACRGTPMTSHKDDHTFECHLIHIWSSTAHKHSMKNSRTS